MRYPCNVMLPTGICGKPSVGCAEFGTPEGRLYLCAEHWDELQETPKDDTGEFD